MFCVDTCKPTYPQHPHRRARVVQREPVGVADVLPFMGVVLLYCARRNDA